MSIYAYHLLKGLGISEQRLVRMLPSMQSRALESHVTLYPRGSIPDTWTHIESGLITACMPLAGESTVSPVHIYGPGTWVGEATIVQPQAISLEYVTLTASRIISMPIADARDAFEQEPEFARYIARLVTWRNQQHAEMLTLLHIGGPQLRVVMGLALFAEALKSSASHLPTSGHEPSLDIPLKQAVLASLCGVSRSVFSECVQQLAVGGWLRLDYGMLSLLQVDTWGRFSKRYRQTRLTAARPTMPELMDLMRDCLNSPRN